MQTRKTPAARMTGQTFWAKSKPPVRKRKQCGGKAQKALCIPRFFTGVHIPLKKRSAPWMPREKRGAQAALYPDLRPFSLKPQRNMDERKN